MPASFSVNGCFVNYIYLVSHYLNYDDEFLNKDESIQEYNIIRHNYPDNGYLPFILSLLQTSTYTLVIKDGYFTFEYPGALWVSQAISELRKRQSKDVATCHIEESTQYGTPTQIPKGCLFFKSIHLRSILTTTVFRRNNIEPFFFFYQSFRCRFHSRLISIPTPLYHEPTKYSWFLFKTTEKEVFRQFTYEDLTSNCETSLEIESVSCEISRPDDGLIGVILSQYKRDYIDEQIDAIMHSSVEVFDIFVYQNGNYRNYKDVFTKYPFLHHIWSTNWNSPFFLRHLLPMLFQTSKHVMFDDDIIPGVDTLKVLISTVEKYDAPTGVGGRIIQRSDFQDGTYRVICVDCYPQNETVPVDFIIQVYARTELQTKVFWKYRPYTHRNGEDIHCSLSWFLECGKRAYRAPFNQSARYKNYGTDNVATYFTKNHNILRPRITRYWIMGGYQPIMEATMKRNYPPSTPFWEQQFAKRVIKYF